MVSRIKFSFKGNPRASLDLEEIEIEKNTARNWKKKSKVSIFPSEIFVIKLRVMLKWLETEEVPEYVFGNITNKLKISRGNSKPFWSKAISEKQTPY